MSGGSGALLNAHTWRALRQQQLVHHHHESACGGAPPSPLHGLELDLDIEHDICDPSCLPFDLEWDQPDFAPFQDTAASQPEAPQVPVGSVVNTSLFPLDGPLLLPQHERECCGVLEQAFRVPSQGLIKDLPQLIETVATQSNFLICDITRLHNTAQRQMHEQFQSSYAITNTRQVYHGTGQAPLIARVGFRGAASERAKFGKGIYTSSCIFHALAYAELTPEDKLTVLVVQLHVGATGVGKQDQVDFGHNAQGERIFTLTNPEGDIYCASHGTVLCVSRTCHASHASLTLPLLPQRASSSPPTWSPFASCSRTHTPTHTRPMCACTTRPLQPASSGRPSSPTPSPPWLPPHTRRA